MGVFICIYIKLFKCMLHKVEEEASGHKRQTPPINAEDVNHSNLANSSTAFQRLGLSGALKAGFRFKGRNNNTF